MEIWKIVALLATGVFAGFINSVAGGGSSMTVPMLIFLGLPPQVANGTNRIALLIQNIFGVIGFRRKGVSDFRFGILLAIPTTIGAIFGSTLVQNVTGGTFKRLLAGVMIGVLLITLINPKREIKKERIELTFRKKILSMILFFFVGIYGGFIQIGTGLLIIAMLTGINHFSLVRTNAIKLFVIFFYTPFSLFIFAKNGNVDWILGSTLAVGNSIGVWFGSHWAVEKGEKWIRTILIAAVILFAIKLVWQSVT